jgi:hypothetical protein
MRCTWTRRAARRLPGGLALLAIASCGGGPPNPYPDDVVKNFVDSCRTRAAESVCTCAIDKIQRRWTLDEFKALEARLAQGEMPKELVDTVADCAGR